MFLPPEYAWVELVIIAALVVFVSDLIGNMVSFNNRFMNAFNRGGRFWQVLSKSNEHRAVDQYHPTRVIFVFMVTGKDDRSNRLSLSVAFEKVRPPFAAISACLVSLLGDLHRGYVEKPGLPIDLHTLWVNSELVAGSISLLEAQLFLANFDEVDGAR